MFRIYKYVQYLYKTHLPPKPEPCVSKPPPTKSKNEKEHIN